MTSNQDSAVVYKDLSGFLQSSRQDLRLEATKAVLQVVSDRNEVLQLLEHGVLLPLLRIVSDTMSENTVCAENALKAILYLSSSAEEITNTCVEQLLEHKAVPRLVELVLACGVGVNSGSSGTSTTSTSGGGASSAKIVNLGLGVLANLTRTEKGCLELVGKTLPDYAVQKVDSDAAEQPARPTMELLLDRYLNDNNNNNNNNKSNTPVDYSALEPQDWDTLHQDPYQHFAAILMNATQVESGRKFVLRIPQHVKKENKNDPTLPSILERLLHQLQSTNPIRRRGISGMIRNCCLETELAWWMLNVVNIATPLLYPLAGPEELDLDEKTGMDPDLWLQGPDKQREVDGPTRQHLVECLLLLFASGRQARKTLRMARTYVILKYADQVEELEEISDRINECVQYLRRDEEGTVEGSSDRLVTELGNTLDDAKTLKLLPSSQVGGAVLADGDYDGVD